MRVVHRSAYGYVRDRCWRHSGLEVKEIALLLFVEYHNVFREAASVVMDQQEDLEVVFQASSVARGWPRAG